MKQAYSKAFTLIELLIVIAIIGILSGVVLNGLTSQKAKARDARRAAELDSFKGAIDLYFEEQGVFPQSLDDVKNSFGGTIHKDPQGRDYSYKNLSTNSEKSYCLGTKMEVISQNTLDCSTDVTGDNYTIKGP